MGSIPGKRAADLWRKSPAGVLDYVIAQETAAALGRALKPALDSDVREHNQAERAPPRSRPPPMRYGNSSCNGKRAACATPPWWCTCIEYRARCMTGWELLRRAVDMPNEGSARGATGHLQEVSISRKIRGNPTS